MMKNYRHTEQSHNNFKCFHCDLSAGSLFLGSNSQRTLRLIKKEKFTAKVAKKAQSSQSINVLSYAALCKCRNFNKVCVTSVK